VKKEAGSRRGMKESSRSITAKVGGGAYARNDQKKHPMCASLLCMADSQCRLEGGTKEG